MWSGLKIKLVRQVSLSRKCTPNESLLALLSVTLHDYLTKKSRGKYSQNLYKVPEKVVVGVPYSHRRSRTRIENVSIQNQLVMVPFELPVMPDFKKAQKEVSIRMDRLKLTFDPQAHYYATMAGLSVPNSFQLLRFLNSATLCSFQNVWASKIRFELMKKPLLNHFILSAPPNLDKIGLNFSISTVGQVTSLVICSDSAFVSNPSELMDMFKKRYEAGIEQDVSISREQMQNVISQFSRARLQQMREQQAETAAEEAREARSSDSD